MVTEHNDASQFLEEDAEIKAWSSDLANYLTGMKL